MRSIKSIMRRRKSPAGTATRASTKVYGPAYAYSTCSRTPAPHGSSDSPSTQSHWAFRTTPRSLRSLWTCRPYRTTCARTNTSLPRNSTQTCARSSAIHTSSTPQTLKSPESPRNSSPTIAGSSQNPLNPSRGDTAKQKYPLTSTPPSLPPKRRKRKARTAKAPMPIPSSP